MKTAAEGAAASPVRVPVWDPLVRLLHWALVLSVFGSWLTRHGDEELHELVGWVALAVVIVRVLWGFLGPRYARFRQFVRGPGAGLDYLGQAVGGRAPRYVGHNPLGGWMTVTLLLLVAAIAGTGWLYTTDRFWGVAWVGNLHLWLTNALLGLVGLHVLGVVWTSLKSRENLVAAMVHGRKAPAGPGDVD